MKAALFDLDGVLIDTEPAYGRFWGNVGKKYNLGGDVFAQQIKGCTLSFILTNYIPEDIRTEVVDALEAFECTMQYPLFEGAEKFLSELSDAGVPCAIVTSSNNDKMNNLWRQHPGLRKYFAAVITDEDVTNSKPDPEPYIVAAKSLGVESKDCMVFEDSINGVISGRRAGSKVVALATTNPVEVLKDKSDIIFNNISDLSLEKLI